MSIKAPDEATRLLDYYPGFRPDVVARVAAVADEQRRATLAGVVGGLARPEWYTPKYGKPIRVLDHIPGGGDYKDVCVAHSQMFAWFDAVGMFQIATLARLLPNTRVIASANPSFRPRSSGLLSFTRMREVWGGDLRHAVSPILQYLSEHKIAAAAHVGGSAGANRGVAAAQCAPDFDQRVTRGVFIDPRAGGELGLLALKDRMYQCGEVADEYEVAVACEAHGQAVTASRRANFDRFNLWHLGALRPTNLAIARALGRDAFGDGLSAALGKNEGMAATVYWGDRSEITTHGLMLDTVRQLRKRYSGRMHGDVLKGQRHAMLRDPYLFGALVLQGMAVSGLPGGHGIEQEQSSSGH